MVYGAILAGGVGKRIERHSVPKQFIHIGGVPIILLTIRKFLNCPQFDMVYIAIHRDWINYSQRLLGSSFSKEELSRIRIVPGGKERLDSFSNIIDEILLTNGMQDDDILICHDSVRPFVDARMIEECIEMTRIHGLALTVIPVNDTIHTTHDDPDFIDGSLDRNSLFSGQTPSGFRLSLLHKVLAECDESEKEHITGTTQLMLNAGYRIKTVKGSTRNFKITTDNDLDVADRIVRTTHSSPSVQLLDCTLRDGGIAINFDFGNNNMKRIKDRLESSGVEFIECGYINEKKGSRRGKSCFIDEQCIAETLLNDGKKEGVTYLAMIDYGTFNLNHLKNADENGLDGIRFAFHKEHMRPALEEASIVLDKGYKLYIQPMVSVRYSDEEFRELIAYCNEHLSKASAFYIVDSFGQMDNMMLMRRMEIADTYVSSTMSIGFHAHNNRQMAFSNAKAFLKHPSQHSIIIDSSIMGMGKGAGNLCTELIMPELINNGKHYSTLEIYAEINDYIASLQRDHPWGYNLDYYLSSLYGCTPSYVNLFTRDPRVTTDILITLLKTIPEAKKSACDRSFAQTHLHSFFGE